MCTKHQKEQHTKQPQTQQKSIVTNSWIWWHKANYCTPMRASNIFQDTKQKRKT